MVLVAILALGYFCWLPKYCDRDFGLNGYSMSFSISMASVSFAMKNVFFIIAQGDVLIYFLWEFVWEIFF